MRNFRRDRDDHQLVGLAYYAQSKMTPSPRPAAWLQGAYSLYLTNSIFVIHYCQILVHAIQGRISAFPTLAILNSSEKAMTRP
jgi:hypothetical protein